MSNYELNETNPETDVDFDDIIQDLDIDMILDSKPKQPNNINNLVSKLESDLDQLNKKAKSKEVPKEVYVMQPKQTQHFTNIESETISKTILNNIKSVCKNADKQIVIYCVLFIILNNNIFIELLNKNLSFLLGKDNMYTNLLLRTMIFGAAVYYINKYNLCNKLNL